MSFFDYHDARRSKMSTRFKHIPLLLLLLCFTLPSCAQKTQEKPLQNNKDTMNTQTEIIYVGDPMCSWCWGISGELSQLVDKYKDQTSYRVIVGGLRPGGSETMAELGDFLKHHWEQVNEKSGREFSYEILSDSSFIYDTEPP